MKGKLQVVLKKASGTGSSVLTDRNIRQLNWECVVSADLLPRQFIVFHTVRPTVYCHVLRPAGDTLNITDRYTV